MKNQQEGRQPRANLTKIVKEDDRRKDERRKQACKGYCYIEMVGWMDRRERSRRDDDCFSD